MKKKGVVRYPEFIALRLETDLRDALERIAEEEDRSVASLIRLVLRDWVSGRDKKSTPKGEVSGRKKTR